MVGTRERCYNQGYEQKDEELIRPSLTIYVDQFWGWGLRVILATHSKGPRPSREISEALDEWGACLWGRGVLGKYCS